MTEKQELPGNELIYFLRRQYRILDKLAATGRPHAKPRGVILGRREADIIEERQDALNDLYHFTDDDTDPSRWTFRGDPVFLADCDSLVGIAFAGDFDKG